MNDLAASADHDASAGSDAGSKYRFAAGLGLELTLAGLLLLTFAAIYFQDAVSQQSATLSRQQNSLYTVSAHGDEANKGTSTIRSGRPLAWSCRLRPTYAFPYCGYALLFDGSRAEKGIDLTHVETVTVDINYHGKGKSLRLYFKNADPRYSHAGAGETTKYNQVEFAVRPGLQRINLKLSDFSVAQWWLTNNSIPPELSRPDFRNVVAIEVETGTGAPMGNHAFRVNAITLHSRRFSRAGWYLSIIACWVALILVFLIQRVIRLSLDLRNRRAQQMLALSQIEAAKRDARTDHLTQVNNRSGLTSLYADLIGQPNTKSVAVLLADVDHFKAVNDRFGHDCGDHVLQSIGQLLREQTREDDLVGRWGGEEFVVILRNCTRADALHAAAKLRAAIEALHVERCGVVTVSFGVHCSAQPLRDLNALIDQADAALYLAKHRGRNRVVQPSNLCDAA